MDADVVVIGAGAAGIFASLRAAELGRSVILLEKTARIGTKILISGGGKCNVTHAGPVEGVLAGFPKEEARFLRPSLYKFSNQDVLDFFTQRGLKVYTRPNGRVFPVEQTAKDVVGILKTELTRKGVDLRLETGVEAILGDSSGITGVVTQAGTIRGNAYVVATGGSSYPKSGTTGDAWNWSLGHAVEPVRAALAPIKLKPGGAWEDRSGVALRGCSLLAKVGGKTRASVQDDILLTHFGISGPAVLSISRQVAIMAETGPVEMLVDFAPQDSFESLSQDILDWCADNPRLELDEYLRSKEIPARVRGDIWHTTQINAETTGNKFDKKSRNRLVEALKAYLLGTVAEVWLEQGEVVAGGFSLAELNPQTMQSSKFGNLFLAGEALAIAGEVGGYNLQAAFSTGYVAGQSAALLAISPLGS